MCKSAVQLKLTARLVRSNVLGIVSISPAQVLYYQQPQCTVTQYSCLPYILAGNQHEMMDRRRVESFEGSGWMFHVLAMRIGIGSRRGWKDLLVIVLSFLQYIYYCAYSYFVAIK